MLFCPPPCLALPVPCWVASSYAPIPLRMGVLSCPQMHFRLAIAIPEFVQQGRRKSITPSAGAWPFPRAAQEPFAGGLLPVEPVLTILNMMRATGTLGLGLSLFWPVAKRPFLAVPLAVRELLGLQRSELTHSSVIRQTSPCQGGHEYTQQGITSQLSTVSLRCSFVPARSWRKSWVCGMAQMVPELTICKWIGGTPDIVAGGLFAY